MTSTSQFTDVLKTIGNTPIVRLNRVSRGVDAQVFAKLEYFNPGGSIKDRIGIWMIEDAEKRGVLKPGGTIIEGTSGNTGFGLAIASAIKGYKCIFVLPDKMSEEKIRSLRAFGAKVIVTPTAVEPEDPRSYYSVCRQLGKETPNSLYIDQYNNLSNRDCHYRTTGPEILRQMPDIDVFIAGIGTGGTICGVGRYLKEKRPQCQVVAVDPIGSLVFDKFHGRDVPAHTYAIEGIGEDFIPGNYDFSVIDDMIQVEDKESFVMTRDLLNKEGIYSGISSGAAVVGALKWIKKQGAQLKDKKVMIIIPDSGNRYLSKVYDDDWMREKGYFEPNNLGCIDDLMHALNIQKNSMISIKANAKVTQVIEIFKEKSISQVPVLDDHGWIKGVVTETKLLKALYDGSLSANSAVGAIADPTVEFISLNESVQKLSKLLTDGKTPLVTDGNDKNVLAILTKIDLLTYLGGKNL